MLIEVKEGEIIFSLYLQMSDSEEEIEVRRWTHKGKRYLIDPRNNNVYDEISHELVGIYNSKSDKIESDEEQIVIEEKQPTKKEQEKERKEKRMEEDKTEKFEVYERRNGERELVFLGYKTLRTNRVYNQLLKPHGIYDPKTRKVDTSKKPPPLEGYEEEDEEEDLDAMIDALDAEIDALDAWD